MTKRSKLLICAVEEGNEIEIKDIKTKMIF
jgi:hypothetical protein